MKPYQLSTLISAITAATLFNLLGVVQSADAGNIQLIGLNDNNTLSIFNSNSVSNTKTLNVTGLDGNLRLIDFRPRDGMLYGLTDNSIFKINTKTGAATLQSTLSIPFTGGFISGGDFNPNPDRLRVVAGNNQNLRINVDTGLVNVDTTPVAYAMGDVNQGIDATITASAYTNSFDPSPDPTRRTTLYNIDPNLDVLVTQGTKDFLPGDPPPATSPNTGQLFTVGKLNVDFGSTGGFDIFSTKKGDNIAFAASGSTLYNIDLSGGGATKIGTIGKGNVNIVGLASQSVPEPATVGALMGLGVFTLVRRFLGSKLSC